MDLFSSLTMHEISVVEKHGGASITSLANEDSPKGLPFAALAMVIKRRTDPTFSWADAQALTMSEVSALIGLSEVESEEEAEESKSDSLS